MNSFMDVVGQDFFNSLRIANTISLWLRPTDNLSASSSVEFFLSTDANKILECSLYVLYAYVVGKYQDI